MLPWDTAAVQGVPDKYLLRTAPYSIALLWTRCDIFLLIKSFTNKTEKWCIKPDFFNLWGPFVIEGLTDCVSSRPGGLEVWWRPCPSGMRQYVWICHVWSIALHRVPQVIYTAYGFVLQVMKGIRFKTLTLGTVYKVKCLKKKGNCWPFFTDPPPLPSKRKLKKHWNFFRYIVYTVRAKFNEFRWS